MLDYKHLEALLAVEQEGSFEAAAKKLCMTSIGVAVRIRKLEERMGVPLLTRKPTGPTKAGTILCDYAASVTALEEDLVTSQLANALQAPAAKQMLHIALNDESQLPWLSEIIGQETDEGGEPWLLDIAFISQDHATLHMNNGELVAGLSSQRQPIHGFKSHSLGPVEYLAVASPDFMKLRFKEGVELSSLENTPCIRLSDKDELCFQWLQQCFKDAVALNCFRMPNQVNQLTQCRSGIGWAMFPRHVVTRDIENGSLCEIVPNTALQKDLYWHVSAIMDDTLRPLITAIREAYRITFSPAEAR